MIGGQLKGDTVKADIGNNLNIESLQDSDNYDYKKLSTSVGASYTYGAGGAQANASIGKTTMNSNWASVTDQSGIYAGKGGYDITVGNNTDLKGAVIASDAEDKTKNKLDTGTISFEDIKNKADYKVDSVNVNIGLGQGNGIGYTPSASPPSVYHNDGSDSSITKSAVEGGTLIVRDTDKQQQNVNELSRDTENANNPLGQIFNKQKEQDKIDKIGLVADIAAQAKDVSNKYASIRAEEQYNALPQDKKAGISKDDYIKNAIKDGGMGNMGDAFSKGIDAASSIVVGIIKGDITGGLAGASAPYLAGLIKENTYERDDKGNIIYENGVPKVNTEANLIAHAILGGAVAAAQGNSSLAGASGAVSGEAAVGFIKDLLYGKDTKIEDLTQAQKENLSSLAQIAGGLAVASVGGSTSDVGAAVSASKNAVENNGLASVVVKYGVKKCVSNSVCRKEAIDFTISISSFFGFTVSESDLSDEKLEKFFDLLDATDPFSWEKKTELKIDKNKIKDILLNRDSESNDNSDIQVSVGSQTGSGTASGGAMPPNDDKDKKDKGDSKKKETSDNGRDFFDNTSYTEKVKRQSSQGDNHGFPESVDGFADKGKVTEFKGGDGKTYWKLEIKGEYKGKQGIFEYIKGADGKINHRLFVPNK